jgi:hypothetical protein
MKAVIAIAGLLLAGCVSAPLDFPARTDQPFGFSTYGRMADGRKVRLWTDNLTHTTTGTIGDENVRW